MRLERKELIELINNKQYQKLEKIIIEDENKDPFIEFCNAYLHEIEDYGGYSLFKARKIYEKCISRQDSISQSFYFFALHLLRNENSDAKDKAIDVLKSGLHLHPERERILYLLLTLFTPEVVSDFIIMNVELKSLNTFETVIPYLLIHCFKNHDVKLFEWLAEQGILENYLNNEEYIDKKGKVTDKLKLDLKDGKVNLPQEYEDSKEKIIKVMKKIAGNLNIKNKDDKRAINVNKRRFLSPEFKDLWDRIKYKTTFSVNFDTEELIKICSEEIMKNLKVDKAKLVYSKADIDINEAGTVAEENDRYTLDVENARYILPDVITYLQNETNLTRKTLVRILKESKRLEDFKNNPQKFMDEVSIIIQRKMRYLIVDGIKYEKLGEDEFYAQELFENKELSGYLSKNMLESDKSVYDYVVYDSDVEAEFAKKFESNNRVKVYAKLPNWFKIETPLGNYNPDWAVLIEKDGQEKLYFVIETKGNILAEELRGRELSKIACGHKHFEAIGNGVQFEQHDDFNEFIESI